MTPQQDHVSKATLAEITQIQGQGATCTENGCGAVLNEAIIGERLPINF